MITVLSSYRFSIPLCVAVFTLCMLPEHHIPRPPSGIRHIFHHLPFGIDKIVHFTMFFAVAGAAFIDHSRLLKLAITKAKLWGGSLLFPIIFGGAIELAQENFTATRTGDWNDLLADSLGAATALVICWHLNRRLKKREQDEITSANSASGK